tara:strand:- start:13 stop:300 length:288 start_codon:yes stop_codon:yes gene_type:complete
LLDERGTTYAYREYTQEPLSRDELERVFSMLGVSPKALLRKNDKAYKENGLSGNESDSRLLDLMVEHPTLLQRPIAILGEKAVVGRPAERILELL